MEFNLTKPCRDCPFRTDRIFELTPARAQEICDGLLGKQQTFSCHKTITHDAYGDSMHSQKTEHCAGAMIFLEKQQRPNQMMRIAERLGYYDRTHLAMDAPVFASTQELVTAMQSLQPRWRRKIYDAGGD